MSAVFPLRYVVDVRHREDGAVDDFGNPVEGYGEWTTGVGVYGWGAPQSDEPKLAGHDREIVDVELYVPPEFPTITHRDQIRLDGVKFDVVGSTEKYDHSPFGWNPGGLINLRKVTG